MVTDDERREVATRLRNNASQDMDWMVPWAVFNDAEQHASEAVVRRLADLIEPSCDRDALLVLADGLDRNADNIISAAPNAQFTGGRPRMGAAKRDADGWRCMARYIRRALGVEP